MDDQRTDIEDGEGETSAENGTVQTGAVVVGLMMVVGGALSRESIVGASLVIGGSLILCTTILMAGLAQLSRRK